MFLSFKIKPVLIFLLVIVCGIIFSFALVFSVNRVTSGALNYTIALDAGHGGVDGGCVGRVTGVKESDLNLLIVRKLERYLTNFGFKVILTRKDENGLYDKFDRNYKLDDMSKRKAIIEKNNANLVVSIHMNSHPSKSSRGAQAFFYQGDEVGRILADTIQQELVKNIDGARKSSSSGDYYILNCTQNPSVMIECGFLSNPEEEKLLSTDEYQEKMAYFIFSGIIKFFETINTMVGYF